ncbi:hypothetical protein F4824DRAFT_505830 [Ustulina deusta]|nr:hypothetical protein F4824DRAFT_505830 [Ustulina deusta]
MTRNSPRLSDDNTRRRHHHRQPQEDQQQQQQYEEFQSQRSHSRPPSQHNHCPQSPHTQSSPHHHSGTRSPHSPAAHHSPKTLHKPSKSSPSSQNHHGPSPLKMVTTTAPVHSPPDDAQYYYLPDVEVPDEQHSSHAWMEPIVIDDEDLMFGGKSLSAWYEEERQSLGYPIDEENEERRGRQRMRQQHHHQHHHQHHQHHEHRHHHHPHHHMSSSTKNAPGNSDQKRH